jgi:hypothetical protein
VSVPFKEHHMNVAMWIHQGFHSSPALHQLAAKSRQPVGVGILIVGIVGLGFDDVPPQQAIFGPRSHSLVAFRLN